MAANVVYYTQKEINMLSFSIEGGKKLFKRLLSRQRMYVRFLIKILVELTQVC